VSRHRRRAIAFALAGVVLALLAVTRLSAGTASRPVAADRVVERVVALRTIPAGSRIAAADLGIVDLPAAAASQHQLSAPAQAVGRRAAVTLAVGAPVMDAELLVTPAPADAREVAVRLDDAAGVPAGDLTDVRADVYVTPPGRRGRPRLVLQGVVVLSAAHTDNGSVATLLLPRSAVPLAIAAEAAGALRLVVDTVGGRR
jgi:Flp pilus assembly protein CpaB